MLEKWNPGVWAPHTSPPKPCALNPDSTVLSESNQALGVLNPSSTILKSTRSQLPSTPVERTKASWLPAVLCLSPEPGEKLAS